ncbi:MAG TPA: hypothetical protein VI818_05070 [Candidatus Thermoplasmatota archaeon]|nr:hypothetical protein [Candidatus Thermoplasmatota archaeon]
MLKIDLIIGGVIGAAILFSIVGVATYERTGGSVPYDVTFPTTDRDLGGQPFTGTRMGNGNVEVNVPVADDNLTKLALQVRVQGGGPRSQTVTIAIILTAPEGNVTQCTGGTMAAPGQAATVNGACEAKLAAAPEPVTVDADSNDTALQAIAGKYNRTAGQGTWKVRVTVTGNPSVPMVPAPQETYTITINGKATTFMAAANPKTPDIQAR